MDPWMMFCELCRRVVTDQNVALEVMIFDGKILMTLEPIDDYGQLDWEDDEDE